MQPKRSTKANQQKNDEVAAIMAALAEPFDPSEVRFKPAVVSGNRALALGYVDARVIQDRLDDVLGVDGWQDSYKCLEDGTVVCRLSLRLGPNWITKMDVGSPSEQSDSGDRRKAAFSDALKRAAVKFGIGRYLYRFPVQWVDYDPQRKTFARPPKLPAFAIPKKQAAEDSAEPAAECPLAGTANGKRLKDLPATGMELEHRLREFDNALARRRLSRQGELIQAVVEAGIKAGYGPDLTAWKGEAIEFAATTARQFEFARRNRQVDRRDVA